MEQMALGPYLHPANSTTKHSDLVLRRKRLAVIFIHIHKYLYFIFIFIKGITGISTVQSAGQSIPYLETKETASD